MAWKALRNLNGYTLDLFYSSGQVIENPDAVQDNSPVTFGNTPVSKSSLPTSTGELWFNITNNLAINFCFNYVGDSSFDTNTAHCWIYLNSRTSPGYWTGGFGCGGNYPRYVAYSIFIDDENQKACIVWRYHYKYRWGQPGALYDNDSKQRSKSEYDSAIYTEIKSVMVTTANGGGATHIAKQTGQLKDLSNYLSDILIVSGGGGGGLIIGENAYNGADAGGISGSGNNSGNQSSGYAFGQGESGTNDAAGGGGFYGGYKDIIGGGAGSGYIGNSLLSNKKMVGYNVPISSTEGTKTESINEVSAIPVSDKPKAGNGHARIKFLRVPEPSSKVFFEANFNADGRDKVNYGNNNVTMSTYDGDYEYITRTAKQGELINFFESCAWSVVNGALNISLATLINSNTPLFIWGYDTDVVNQQFFPQDCTVTIEIEVFFETATSYIFFNTYDDYGDGELYSQGADFTLDVSELTTHAWHNIQVKFDTSMNYDSCYVDNEQVDIVDGYGGTFPCVIDDEDLAKCHAIGLRISEIDSPVLKIRKFKVYYT